VLAGLHEVS